MRQRAAVVSAAAIVLLSLCACGAATLVPKKMPVVGDTRPAANKNCSTPTSDGGVLASVNLKFQGELDIGGAASAQIEIQGSFSRRGRTRGALKKPLHFALGDPLGHVRLSCNVVWNLYHGPTIYSDGHGDAFSVNVTDRTLTASRWFWTNLPKDIPLSTQSPYITASWLRFGSDGNLWAPLSFTVRPVAVARISVSGKTTIFTDPVAPNSPAINEIALGPDGNMWIPYYNSYGSGASGMDRIAPNGTFTGFPLSGSDAYSGVTSMTAGHNHDIILGLQRLSGGAIASFHMDGTMTVLAATSQPPTNLVWNKNGDLWFLLESIDTRSTSAVEIGKLTPGGTLSTYSICCFNKFLSAFTFTAAPDGNFWAPYPCGKSMLLKFDTHGHVVSKIKVTYLTPWELVPLTAPDIVDYAADSSGNVYAADEGNPGTEFGGSGLIRITPSGEMTEYPTFRPVGGEPTSVVYEPTTNRIYLANSYYILHRSSEGSIVPLDPKSW